MGIDRDLVLIHRLQQRRLSLGSRAIDLVGQQDIGEHRATLELELLFRRRVNRDADHVRRQHIAGELHSLKAAFQGAGNGLAERRFPHAGDAFNQQMSAGQQANHRQPNHFVLAANHFPQGVFELSRARGNGTGGFRRHYGEFYYGVGSRQRLRRCGKAISS